MEDMERAVEAIGVDVEAAIEVGLARLGVGREAVEVEVLDDGSRGLFGLGAREARVRLSPKPQAMPKTGPAASPDEPVGPVQTFELPIEEPGEPPISDLAEAERNEAEVARSVLLELLALLDMDGARVEVRYAEPTAGEGEPPLILDIYGTGTDALIGRRGTTMAALQHITRLVVGREIESRVHLVVDVAGFKARRQKSLGRLARRMAEQAMRTRRTVTLEPMPPHERRIIHLTLRGHSDVTTESIGEKDRRKVTIIPR